jgi:hypothetical protein
MGRILYSGVVGREVRRRRRVVALPRCHNLLVPLTPESLVRVIGGDRDACERVPRPTPAAPHRHDMAVALDPAVAAVLRDALLAGGLHEDPPRAIGRRQRTCLM